MVHILESTKKLAIGLVTIINKALKAYPNVYADFILLPSHKKNNLRRTRTRSAVFVLSDTSTTLEFIIEVRRTLLDSFKSYFDASKHT